jgi:DNA gyrase/topoisomerase IV subunit A
VVIFSGNYGERMTTVTIDLEKIQSDIARLKDERDDLDRELAQLEMLQNAAKRYIIKDKSAKGRKNGAETTPVVAASNLVDKPLFHAARAVLRAADRTMKTNDISEAILASGIGKGVSDLNTKVFTAMKRKTAIFDKVGRSEWRLIKGADVDEQDD